MISSLEKSKQVKEIIIVISFLNFCQNSTYKIPKDVQKSEKFNDASFAVQCMCAVKVAKNKSSGGGLCLTLSTRPQFPHKLIDDYSYLFSCL